MAGVRFYEHIHYRGRVAEFGAGAYDLPGLIARRLRNDTASSLKVRAGWTVTVYEHHRFRGRSRTFTRDHSHFPSIRWNDIVSSLIVSPPATPAESESVTPALPPNFPSIVPASDDSSALFAKALHATCNLVVRKRGGWYAGTAFVASVDGAKVICTVAHNIMDGTRNSLASRIMVALHPEEESKPPVQLECDVSKCYVAGAADLAILTLTDPSHLESVPALSISTASPAVGSRCCVVGNPLNFDTPSLCEGVVRDTNFVGTNLVEYIVFSAPVYGGNSGSPVLNPDGSIIGVISFAASFSSDPVLSCLTWGASWRMISHVVKAMHTKSEHFVGGHLGMGTNPAPVRLYGGRASGTQLVGYELEAAAWGIQTSESIVGIETDTHTAPLGAYPGYRGLSQLYLNPGTLTKLVVSGVRGLRNVAVSPQTLPTSLDVPAAGRFSRVGGRLLGPLLTPKENSPDSAQDGGD